MAIFAPAGRWRPLVEAPRELVRAGLRPGLALREAESRWPDVDFRPDDPARYAEAFRPVLELLDTFSPTVEWPGEPAETASGATASGPIAPPLWPDPAPFVAFLDGAGLEGLYGSEDRLGALIVRAIEEEMGYAARVGIADGRFAAWAAAVAGAGGQGGTTISIVPPGRDAAFLAPLTVALLPLPGEARGRLAKLGVRTLGQFASLPPNGIRHRFGPEGVRARGLAAGLDDAPLRPRPSPLVVRDALELEWVETDLDRLTFLLKQLADRLGTRLGHHGLGAGRLRVTWTFEAGAWGGDDWDGGDAIVREATIAMAEPRAEGAGLLEHLRWHVEGVQRGVLANEAASGTGTPGKTDAPGGVGALSRVGESAASGVPLGGVRAIAVEAEELAPLVGRQLPLLPGEDGRAADPERQLAAQRALARLRARWGDEAVRQAEPVAARRLELAFRWRAPELLSGGAGSKHQASSRDRGRTRRAGIRHPGPVGVPELAPMLGEDAGRAIRLTPLWLAADGEDVQVERGGVGEGGRRRPPAIERRGRRRRIVHAEGPWRLVEAWAEPPVARDEYHVVTTANEAAWLAYDHADERWRLLGTFD